MSNFLSIIRDASQLSSGYDVKINVYDNPMGDKSITVRAISMFSGEARIERCDLDYPEQAAMALLEWLRDERERMMKRFEKENKETK